MNKLEEAAEYYAKEIHFNQFCELCAKYRDTAVAYHDLTKYHKGIIDGIDKICEKAFIAGVKWQEEQSAGKEQDSMLAASLIGADLAKPKWISVKDKLPKVGEKVLVINDGNIEISSCFERFDGKAQWDVDYPTMIKYWMPIPELPKGGEE